MKREHRIGIQQYCEMDKSEKTYVTSKLRQTGKVYLLRREFAARRVTC